MKQSVILMALWLAFFGAKSANAQTNFEETYKKASDFTNTNQDSALVWAKKSLWLAQSSQQKYDAAYVLAYNAYKLCLFGLALKGYQQALEVAANSTDKYRAINSLASTYLRKGDYTRAQKLNEQSIRYFEHIQNGYSLSYSYELEGAILQKQKDYCALAILRKALKLRKKHAPKEIGAAYQNIADAFAHFNIPDSAVVYQRKALDNYPLKSPDQIANQHILLAKYLMRAKQTAQALSHLRVARKLAKQPLTELFWSHTFSLYLVKTNDREKASRTLEYCDSLRKQVLNSTQDAITRKTISEQLKAMYEDAPELKELNVVSYRRRLELVQVVLDGANRELKITSNHHGQDLDQPPFAMPAHVPGYFWWVVGLSMVITGGGLWFGWSMWRKSKKKCV